MCNETFPTTVTQAQLIRHSAGKASSTALRRVYSHGPTPSHTMVFHPPKHWQQQPQALSRSINQQLTIKYHLLPCGVRELQRCQRLKQVGSPPRRKHRFPQISQASATGPIQIPSTPSKTCRGNERHHTHHPIKWQSAVQPCHCLYQQAIRRHVTTIQHLHQNTHRPRSHIYHQSPSYRRESAERLHPKALKGSFNHCMFRDNRFEFSGLEGCTNRGQEGLLLATRSDF